jgi:hypothetical protein
MSERDPYDSGDEQHVKAGKTKAERAVARERERVRRAWSNPDARWLLYSILDRSGIHARTFKPGMPDVSAYNQGARELGLLVYEQVMEVCPELFALAKNEFTQKEETTNE